MKTVAIVLAAGSGKRMGGPVKKQFMSLNGYPVLYYSLKVFEDSFIDEVVLVCSTDDMDMIKKDIIARYGFTKVKHIVEGGKERYHSVLCGLKSIEAADYAFIHDGARPLIDLPILNRGLEGVKKHDACVIAVKSKDTVKIADEEGFVVATPNRNCVWNMQTPQIFNFKLILDAYTQIVANEDELKAQGVTITDDAMVLEQYKDIPIKLIEGSYENIKVTTAEDIVTAEGFLVQRASDKN